MGAAELFSSTCPRPCLPACLGTFWGGVPLPSQDNWNSSSSLLNRLILWAQS